MLDYRVNTRRVCDVVGDDAKDEINGIVKRPWNRFKPEECSWWLVPSAKQPHYQFGKYFFSPSRKAGKDFILGGFYVEKGLDPSISAVYSSRKAKRFITDTSWCWNRFMEQIKDRSFFNRINALGLGLPIEINIDGGYVSEPVNFDPYQEKNLLGGDRYSFSLDTSTSKITINETKRKAFVLKLHHVKSVDVLVEVLEELSKDPWLWLNINVALRFELQESSEKLFDLNGNSWGAEDLWEKYLICFKSLIN